MKLQEFNKQPAKTIQRLNTILSEQFGIAIKPGTASLDKLQKLNSTANNALIKIRAVSYTHLTLPTTPYV